MFVCVCNALNDKVVRAAIDSGAGTVSGVYRDCGCAAQCGRCAGRIRELLAARRPEAPRPLAG